MDALVYQFVPLGSFCTPKIVHVVPPSVVYSIRTPSHPVSTLRFCQKLKLATLVVEKSNTGDNKIDAL